MSDPQKPTKNHDSGETRQQTQRSGVVSGDILVQNDEIIDTTTGEIYGTTARSSKLSISQLQDKLASRSEKFWQQMRSNLNLMERSDKVALEKCDKFVQELGDLLDLGILNYPPTLKNVGLHPDMSYLEKKYALDIPNGITHTENEQKFIQKGAYNAAKARKANWQWRIAQEAEEKQIAGWYPFFVTLTIDPKKTGPGKEYNDPAEIWKNGREFRKYIRELADIVCKELGHRPCRKPPYRPESDYVTYAGVIEHGKSRDHHHGHFIVWLRDIPASWKVDPNTGINNPALRFNNECLPMRTIWPWSAINLSPALYFRSIGDVWSTRYGFVTPLVKDKKSGKVAAQKMAPPHIAGAYITKYLQKEHKKWNHRVKATRNLGMTKLKATLASIDPTIVEALSWRPMKSHTNTSIQTIHSVPQGLIRSAAKHQTFLNQYKARQLDLKKLLRSNAGVFSKMLQSVRNGARPDRMGSVEFYDWVGGHLPEIEGYSNSRLLAAHTVIATIYPKRKRVAKHIKIPGNDDGYT